MNPFNARVRAILRREYLTRVRSRWFVFSTLGVPLLLAGLGWFSVWMVSGAGEGGGFPTVAVVDRSDRLAEAVVAELEVDSIAGRTAPELASLSEDELRPRLLASGLDAFLVLPPGLLAGEGPGAEADADEPVTGADGREPTAEVRVLARGSVSPGTRRTLRDAVNRALVRGRLEEAGLRDVDTRALLEEAELTFIGVSEEGARSQETVQIAAFIMALVFYGVLLFYGQMIVRSVVEEKTSDIVEVVVSSVRPWELMLGQIVGVGAVGLTQLTVPGRDARALLRSDRRGGRARGGGNRSSGARPRPDCRGRGAGVPRARPSMRASSPGRGRRSPTSRTPSRRRCR